jgi:hypothetical protein
MLDAKGLISLFIEPWRTSRFANIHHAPWDFVGNMRLCSSNKLLASTLRTSALTRWQFTALRGLSRALLSKDPQSSGLIASSLRALICGAACISNGIA